MRTAERLELSKMRRLRVVPMCVVMVAAIVALTATHLGSESARAGFADPAAQPWEQLLLNYVMAAAMTSPVLVAVLAGRQVDIEHQGQGWTLARVAGLGPGRVCRAKATVLGTLLVLVVLVQTVLLAGAGLLAGIEVAFPLGLWVRYALTLALADLALLCVHLWLSARIDNQLVGVGVGLLGAFYAVFSLLTPPAVAYVLPWGYYAAISPVATGDGGRLVEATPVYPLLVLFLTVVVVLFVLACRRFDRAEGGPA